MTKQDFLQGDVNTANFTAVREGAGNSLPNGDYNCIIVKKGDDYDVTYRNSTDKVGSVIIGAWSAADDSDEAPVGQYRVAYDKFMRACGYNSETPIDKIAEDVKNKVVHKVRCTVTEPSQISVMNAEMKGLQPGDEGYPRTTRRFTAL